MSRSSEPVARACRSPWLDVEDLIVDLRRNGFDLRRAYTVTYLVDTGPSAEQARAARERAAADGWLAWLYADASGWVVRLSRTGCLQRRVLARDSAYADRLAHTCRGSVRGMTVEDAQPRDSWFALAARVRADSTLVGAPRPRVAGHPRHAERGRRVVARSA